MAASGFQRASEIAEGFDRRVAELGFELVELRRRGRPGRPVFELRIDRLSGDGVSVGDCAAVSRALEDWLDGDPDHPERYVLQVSSPGVERRLTRDSHFERFAGRRVAVRGGAEGGGSRIEGELLGAVEENGERMLRLRVASGGEVDIPRAESTEVRLVFDWKGGVR